MMAAYKDTAFFAVVIALFAVYLTVSFLLKDRKLPAGIQDLVDSKIHYALIGSLLMALLPEPIRPYFGQGRDYILTILVGWIGFDLGRHIEFRRLTKISGWLFSTITFQALSTFTLIFLALYIPMPQLPGVFAQLLPYRTQIALVLAAASSTMAIRRTFHVDSTGPVTSYLTEAPPLANCLIVLILTVCTVLSQERGDIIIKEIVVSGWVAKIGVAVILGFGTGILLDMLSRDDLDYKRKTAPMLGALILGCGLAVALQLPVILIGLVSGAWLINTTLRRREVINLVNPPSTFLEGIFMILWGTLIGEKSAPDLYIVLVMSLPLFAAAGVAKILGAHIGAWLFTREISKGREVFGLGLLPCGSISLVLVLIGTDALPILSQNIALISILTATILSRLAAPYSILTALTRTGEVKKQYQDPRQAGSR